MESFRSHINGKWTGLYRVYSAWALIVRTKYPRATAREWTTKLLHLPSHRHPQILDHTVKALNNLDLELFYVVDIATFATFCASFFLSLWKHSSKGFVVLVLLTHSHDFFRVLGNDDVYASLFWPVVPINLILLLWSPEDDNLWFWTPPGFSCSSSIRSKHSK